MIRVSNRWSVASVEPMPSTMQVKITITNTDEVMQERMEAFRKDPGKMGDAESFVDGIVERAMVEARRRKEGAKGVPAFRPSCSDQGSCRKQSGWHLRFRGYLLRMCSTVCPWVCICDPSAGGSRSS